MPIFVVGAVILYVLARDARRWIGRPAMFSVGCAIVVFVLAVWMMINAR